jgi:hypothetical protein
MARFPTADGIYHASAADFLRFVPAACQAQDSPEWPVEPACERANAGCRAVAGRSTEIAARRLRQMPATASADWQGISNLETK